jgi:hypothetical protein
LTDGSRLRIGAGSRLEIAGHLLGDDTPQTLLQLFRGKVRSIVERVRDLAPGTYEVRTETAVIGARGTDFVAYHQAQVTGAIFLEGEGYCYSLGQPDELRTILAGQAMTAVNRFEPPRIRRATRLEMEQNRMDTAPEAAEGAPRAAGPESDAREDAPEADETPSESAPPPAPPSEEFAERPSDGDDAPSAPEASSGEAPEMAAISDAVAGDGGDPRASEATAPRPAPSDLRRADGEFSDADIGEFRGEAGIDLGFAEEGDPFLEGGGFGKEGDFRIPDGPFEDDWAEWAFADDGMTVGEGPVEGEDPRPDRPYTEVAPTPAADGFATRFNARFFGHGNDAEGRWETRPAGDFNADIFGTEVPWIGLPEAPAFYEFFGMGDSAGEPPPLWSTFDTDLAISDERGGLSVGFLSGVRRFLGVPAETGLEGFGLWLYAEPSGAVGVARNPRFTATGETALGGLLGAFFADDSLAASGGFAAAPMDFVRFPPADLPSRLTIVDPSDPAPTWTGAFIGAKGDRFGNIRVDDVSRRLYRVAELPWFTAQVIASGRYAAEAAPTENWVLPLSFAGGDGLIWERAYAAASALGGDLGGLGRMGWVQVAEGGTGIGGGDFLGESDPGRQTWSLVESWTGIETRRFLAMTRDPGGEEALYTLAIPSVAIGRATLSGQRDGFSVRLGDVTFFRHRTGGPAAVWATETVTVAAETPPPTNTPLRLAGPANARVEAIFNLLRWADGRWAGRIREGAAALTTTDGAVRTRFSGFAAGPLGPGGRSGTGTAAGIAVTDVPVEVLDFESEILADAWTGVLLEDGFTVRVAAGFLAGYMEGLEPLWTGDPALFFLSGFYDGDPLSPAEIWFSDPIYSAAPDSLDAVTPDGGAYVALAGGVRVDDPAFDAQLLSAGIGGVFIDPNGGAGILVGDTDSAVLDPEFSEFETVGELAAVALETADRSPEFLAGEVAIQEEWLIDFWAEGYFSDSGDSIWADEVHRASLRIPGRDWGVWQFASTGGYEGPGWGIEDRWTIYLEDNAQGRFWKKGFERYFDALPDSVVTADAHGAWISAQEALTGIAGGTLSGTFDPQTHTWQAVERWAGMTTERFLELAASEAGRERLALLNIPSVEIGRATLEGASDIMDVRMADVTFFSRRTGGDPRIWATDRVDGVAVEPPEAGHLVELSGGGLSADFEIGRWADGRWDAHIWGDGVLERTDGQGRTDLSFEGRAAGPYGPDGQFRGTGSGIAEGFSE